MKGVPPIIIPSHWINKTHQISHNTDSIISGPITDKKCSAKTVQKVVNSQTSSMKTIPPMLISNFRVTLTFGFKTLYQVNITTSEQSKHSTIQQQKAKAVTKIFLHSCWYNRALLLLQTHNETDRTNPMHHW